jgi:uncharacterized protein (TIGR03083 family)
VNSPAHLGKSAILDGLFASWDEIDRLMTGVPDAQWTAPTPLPGWCVHDVVAHVIGTESMLSGVATPQLARAQPHRRAQRVLGAATAW